MHTPKRKPKPELFASMETTARISMERDNAADLALGVASGLKQRPASQLRPSSSVPVLQKAEHSRQATFSSPRGRLAHSPRKSTQPLKYNFWN